MRFFFWLISNAEEKLGECKDINNKPVLKKKIQVVKQDEKCGCEYLEWCLLRSQAMHLWGTDFWSDTSISSWECVLAEQCTYGGMNELRSFKELEWAKVGCSLKVKRCLESLEKEINSCDFRLQIINRCCILSFRSKGFGYSLPHLISLCFGVCRESSCILKRDRSTLFYPCF